MGANGRFIWVVPGVGEKSLTVLVAGSQLRTVFVHVKIIRDGSKSHVKRFTTDIKYRRKTSVGNLQHKKQKYENRKGGKTIAHPAVYTGRMGEQIT